MKELIEYIVKKLVDNPDQVQIKEVIGDQTSVLELKVAKDDLGQGRSARAIRTILNAASIRLKKRMVLEIIE